MISRRDFLRYAGLGTAGMIADFIVPDFCLPSSEYIDVNIPEFCLRYKGRRFRVSVGKHQTQTPVGKGVIYEKVERPVFRYKDPGPLQGKIIRFCSTIDGRRVRVPYEKMRALGIRIFTKNYGLTEKYRIHSTTEYWNIGRPVSNGCIRLSIPDMLELYPAVPENTLIILRYETIVADDGGFTVFPDIYKKKTNTIESLERMLRERGIGCVEKEKLKKIINEHAGKYISFSDI
ncbi:MAG: L,D-transpeptidase [Candidatus Aenigmatarchaeota archaeon]